MGRPPLPVGTYGKITDIEMPSGQHMARCKFRDYDGTVRLVSRLGKTKTAAANALTRAMVQRQGPEGEGITRNTKLSVLADAWLLEVDASERSIGTKQHYRYVVATYVKPAVGNLRVGEATIAPLDRALTAISTSHGKGSAKSTRSVLSGMFALAGRHDAIATNPVRDTSSIRSARKTVRALTSAEVDLICDQLRASQRAMDLDLPDLLEFMLATGARIGEVCAARETLSRDGKPVLDLDAGTFEINATVIRVRSQGLMIQERPKTAAGWRVLALPPFAVEMIRRRRTELRLSGPGGVVFGAPRARTLRDPSNTPGDIRTVLDAIDCPTCSGTASVDLNGKPAPCPDAGPFAWVTSHTFRKTVATRLEEAGLTPRQVADQLGHSNPSMTLDVYFGRQVVTAEAAKLLER